MTMTEEIRVTATSNPNPTSSVSASSSSASHSSGYDAIDNNNGPSSAMESHPKELSLWHKPWVIALVIFFVFYFIWFQGVIIQRYWIDEDFGKALPGLDKTLLRKTTIRLHLTFGGIAVLCSPFQMVSPFIDAFNKRGRNWYRKIHRYSGRIYVACAILSYICGQWFICLKQFALVGGYNMGISFSAAGFALAYFAYMTLITSPTKNRQPGSRYTVEDHRNYAFRSFSQMIAPILYRYWYIFTAIYTRYRTPALYLNGTGTMGDGSKLVCDDRDVCDDYKRPLDAFYCWFYWMSAWFVAEVVILCLPKHKSATTPFSGDEELDTPLVPNQEPNGVASSGSNDDDSTVEQHVDELVLSSTSFQDDKKRTKTKLLNATGCMLVVLTILVTGPVVLFTISGALAPA